MIYREASLSPKPLPQTNILLLHPCSRRTISELEQSSVCVQGVKALGQLQSRINSQCSFHCLSTSRAHTVLWGKEYLGMAEKVVLIDFAYLQMAEILLSLGVFYKLFNCFSKYSVPY